MPPPADGRTLAGCGVLVTRPAGFNQSLSTLLGAAGATVFEFPLLSIEACPARSPFMDPRTRFDWLIFTSRNAVEQAFGQWPQLVSEAGATGFCAVGAGTAEALRTRGVSQVLIPDGKYGTEGLLALSEFGHPAGQHIGIVSGRDGRPLLLDSLRGRGARVECFEVYSRLPAGADVNDYLGRHGRAIDMIVITSVLALRLLAAGAEGRKRVQGLRYPLVVVSARIAAQAGQLGFVAPIEVAGQVSDEALAKSCLRLWRFIGQ